MSFLSERVKRIQPSPTLTISARAAELKASGIDVISLSAGEPDFETPEHVKQAGIRAINEGKTKYTPVGGIMPLKKAVQTKFLQKNGVHYEVDEIIVSVGAKQIIYNLMMATLNADDEVIIPAPYWVSYPDIVQLADGKPIIISCDESTQFKLQPEQLAKHITPKTKWLILNSPSNPTGEIYTKDELMALAQMIEKYPHLHVLSDDIYEHLIYDNQTFYTLAQVAPQLKDRIVTLNGVSKSHAMTGWRIGYAGAPVALIKAMGKIQSQSTSNPCSISQYAALEALTGNKAFLKERAHTYEKRRDTLVKAINAIPELRCSTPGGAFYLFVNCEELIGKKANAHILQTDQDITAYLLEAARVAVVPGGAFGLSPYVRLSYATSEALLEEAVQRIKTAIDQLHD